MISPIYAFGWTLWERENWLFKYKYTFENATNFGEWFAGFTFGFFPLLLP